LYCSLFISLNFSILSFFPNSIPFLTQFPSYSSLLYSLEIITLNDLKKFCCSSSQPVASKPSYKIPPRRSQLGDPASSSSSSYSLSKGSSLVTEDG
jgi:hypothetical protein